MEPDTSFWASLEAFQFMRHALLAGLLVGLTCSILSVYVVLKRLAFIGQGISHSAFGGVALALYLFEKTASASLKIDATSLVFCTIVAILIGIVSRGRRISSDSAIGIFFAVSMASGVIFISLRRRYTGAVFSYLFGDILGVSSGDVILIAIVGAVVIGIVIAFYKELFFFCFDENLAGVSGLPVRFLHYLLLILLALTIVISIKIVGIILVSAFLVIPGSVARLLTGNFRKMILISITAGTLSVLSGLYLSNELEMPSGATIVLVQFVIFLAAMIARKLRA